jgi:hypothetical protein
MIIQTRGGKNMLSENDLTEKAVLPDKRPRQLLLMGAIWSTVSCLVFATGTAMAYQNYLGKQMAWLITCQLAVIIFMGTAKFIAWKSINFRHLHLNANSSPSNLFHINKLSAQRKLVIYYLSEITLLLLISSAFFLEFRHGVYSLLKLMAPAAIPNYALGIFIIVNFKQQIKKFSKMKVQSDKLYMDHILPN